MKFETHFRFWLIVCFFGIFVVPAVINQLNYGDRIEQDQRELIKTVGLKTGTHIIKAADSIYDTLFVQTHIQKWAMKTYVNKPELALEDKAHLSNGGKVMARYAIALFMNFYEWIFRLMTLAFWFMFTLPFMLAAIFDGFMQRKVNIASFTYSSPGNYNTMMHVMVAMFFLTIFYCGTPIPIYSMTFPVLLIVIAMMMRSMLTNLQRSA